MNKILVVSPSGNWYGSEQVLYDYLEQTRLAFDVYAPAQSLFLDKLRAGKFSHRVRSFATVPKLYLRIFRQLLSNRYQVVYLNEAGHIRYISWLAALFPRKKFVVHVRVLEDTAAERWKSANKKNIRVIAISRFVRDKLPLHSDLLYDGYLFSAGRRTEKKDEEKELLKIAVVGRITKSKGSQLLPGLIASLKELDPRGKYRFDLYGSVAEDMVNDPAYELLKKDPSVRFKGFEQNRDTIYNAAHCVLHLSAMEPLGRIFFEAIDYGKPLVGIDAGGIGEIGRELQMGELLSNPGENNLVRSIAAKLMQLRTNYAYHAAQCAAVKPRAAIVFSSAAYGQYLDNLLTV